MSGHVDFHELNVNTDVSICQLLSLFMCCSLLNTSVLRDTWIQTVLLEVCYFYSFFM